MDSILDLESAEGIIRDYAEELKYFNELPHNWKYDRSRAAAGNLKPQAFIYVKNWKFFFNRAAGGNEEDHTWGGYMGKP
ncbi:hypothetical protein Tco_1380773, partial [Tanacetum coccineum]